MSLRVLYGDVMKIYTSGYNFVLGRFYGIVNLALLASTFLMVKGIDVGFTETIAVGVLAVIGLMVVGWFYLKLGLVKAESQSNFVENPQNMEMLYRLRRIEEKLDKAEVKNND